MRKNKSICLLLMLFMSTVVSLAQGPNDSGTYYKDADGKSGSALKTALCKIINPHTTISYDGLIDAYVKTDTRPDGYVRDWYSNITNFRHGIDKAGSYSKEGDCYNREHAVPQSWFSKASPMKSDIVHVVPTDGYVNNRRSSYPLAEVGSVEWSSANNYSKLGSCKTDGYSGKVFEPNDEIKGDMARIYFYMVTCYEDKATSWGHDIFSSSKYPGLENWYLTMLMRWSKQDPVDDVERNRNLAVYDVQKNRNPFVDYPGLEDYVWGSKKNESFSYDKYSGGGDVPPVIAVAAPVFSMASGAYSNFVEVGMTTETEGATIYYTTDGTTATTDGTVYEGPVMITETTTLKAVAVKNGTVSNQTTATYTINKGGSGDEPVVSVIALNNTFFGVSYSGAISASDSEDLVGKQNGVTVVYALGDGGSNRYCNSEQIRLYQKNKLTFSVSQGELASLEFQLAKDTSKKLSATTGTVNDMTWTGSAKSVTFNVDEGSGNMQLSGVKVKMAQSSDIQTPVFVHYETDIIYTLSGQRIKNPTKPGLYILNGKKIIVK